MQLQSRDLITSHMERIPVPSLAKQIKGHDHDDIYVLQLIVILTRTQHVQIHHPVVIPGSLGKIMRILLLGLHIIYGIPEIFSVHIEEDPLVSWHSSKFFLCLRLVFQRYRISLDDLQHILQCLVILHDLCKQKAIQQVHLL